MNRQVALEKVKINSFGDRESTALAMVNIIYDAKKRQAKDFREKLLSLNIPLESYEEVDILFQEVYDEC